MSEPTKNTVIWQVESTHPTVVDNLRDTLPVDVAYTGNIAGRAIFYRVFSVTAFGMRALLHTATPTAGLTYEPKVDSGPLFGRPRLLDPQGIVRARVEVRGGLEPGEMEIQQGFGALRFLSIGTAIKFVLLDAEGQTHLQDFTPVAPANDTQFVFRMVGPTPQPAAQVKWTTHTDW